MAVTVRWYNRACLYAGNASYQSTGALGSASISWASQPMKLMLVDSSYTFDATHTVYADLTHEIANGFGYTTGGAALTTVALTQATTVTNLTADNVTWTAAGGSIPAFRMAILYCTSTLLGVVKPLILAFDNGVDVAATASGTVLTATFNATGVLQIAHS